MKSDNNKYSYYFYIGKITLLLNCAITILCILYASRVTIPRPHFVAFVLPLALICNVLDLHSKKHTNKHHSLKIIGMLIVVIILLASSIYFYFEYTKIAYDRVSNYNNTDYFFAYFTIILVIYLAFKKLGRVFGTLISLVLFLAIFGRYFPYPFSVVPFRFNTIIDGISLDSQGIWGTISSAMATYIGIFVIFAAIMSAFGGLEALIAFFVRLLGRHEILFPQVATTSSMIFGSFSGSAIANVAGTGSFTIPMMIERGILAEDAAAIETTASTGGLIMPPIMGIAAFIMAEFLNVSYLRIIYAGLLPAMLFYLAIFLNVYWVRVRNLKRETANRNMVEENNRISKGEVKFNSIKKLVKKQDNLLLFFIFFAIIALLRDIAGGLSILRAGFAACRTFYMLCLARLIGTMAISFIRNRKQDIKISMVELKSSIKDFINRTISFLCKVGEQLSYLILLGASLNVVSSTLIQTGLLMRIGNFLVILSRGNVFLLLLVTMILCIFLGMSVSAVATYLLVAPIVVQSFRRLGLEPLTAHFVIFYISCLAPITPPIAPAAALAAKLANADFVSTTKRSLIMATPFFLMPAIFVTYPSILNLDFGVFLILLSAMISISLGCFVDFNKELKKIPNVLLIFLGIYMILGGLSMNINYVISLGILLFLILCFKKYGIYTNR